MKPITEDIIEKSAIEILQSQGWEYANGKEISPEWTIRESARTKLMVLVKRTLTKRLSTGQTTKGNRYCFEAS